MTSRIMAREALSRLIALGRPVREAASFLADKCYNLDLRNWAYVNSDELQPVPPHIWPALRWVSLPDDAGMISDHSEKLSVVGDWFAGRISYWPKYDGAFSERYNIQGLRFDRDEFEALLPEKALTWCCDPIGAKPLVLANDAQALWPAQAVETDVVSKRDASEAFTPTGDPGRPSKGYHLYDAEHRRRCETQKAHATLAEEARYLLDWFKQCHPSAPPPTETTIQNRIRRRHREYINPMPQN